MIENHISISLLYWWNDVWSFIKIFFWTFCLVCCISYCDIHLLYPVVLNFNSCQLMKNVVLKFYCSCILAATRSFMLTIAKGILRGWQAFENTLVVMTSYVFNTRCFIAWSDINYIFMTHVIKFNFMCLLCHRPNHSEDVNNKTDSVKRAVRKKLAKFICWFICSLYDLPQASCNMQAGAVMREAFCWGSCAKNLMDACTSYDCNIFPTIKKLPQILSSVMSQYVQVNASSQSYIIWKRVQETQLIQTDWMEW